MAKPRYPQESPKEYKLREEELADNQSMRTPITFCIDCSYSMRRQGRLDKVMAGLKGFKKDMENDPIASESVEMCIISFGGTNAAVEVQFNTPGRIVIPNLEAEGGTPLSDSVELALENLENLKDRYNDNGISWYKPWLIIIGDGDEIGNSTAIRKVGERLKKAKETGKLNVLCVTIGDEEAIAYSSLMMLSPDSTVQYLKDLNFKEFFSWLSKSAQKMSQSLGGEEVSFAPTSTWATTLSKE